jgi:hypothetical protein
MLIFTPIYNTNFIAADVECLSNLSCQPLEKKKAKRKPLKARHISRCEMGAKSIIILFYLI